MQTFLPYANFHASARVLDRQRLGKQRVEAWQIFGTIQLPSGTRRGWINHPAVRMWRGYQAALCVYGMAVCITWRERGYRDTLLERFMAALAGMPDLPVEVDDWLELLPPWLGDDAFHASHRAALLTKDPEWYGHYRWKEIPRIEYVWPV